MVSYKEIMNNASHSDKKDILIAALEERYEAMRVIRQRVQGVSVWALGLMVAAAGWLIQTDVFISSEQKLLYILGLSLAFWVLRFKYFDDLQKGFLKQLHVAARLEKALGFYSSGEFNDSKEPIYPKEWEHAGGKNGRGNFFSSTYLLLYVGVAILVVAILLHSGYHPHHFWF